MTIMDRDFRSRTTVLSLWEAGARLDSGTVDEADIVFFVPPGDEALTCRVRAGYDEDSGRIDRTVGYFDPAGRPVAEVFLSGPVGREQRDAFTPITEELVRFVEDSFEPHDVRRVRMRICASTSSTASLTWSCRVLQWYRTDYESVEDVAVVCTDPSGAVVARAWVTVSTEGRVAR